MPRYNKEIQRTYVWVQRTLKRYEEFNRTNPLDVHTVRITLLEQFKERIEKIAEEEGYKI